MEAEDSSDTFEEAAAFAQVTDNGTQIWRELQRSDQQVSERGNQQTIAQWMLPLKWWVELEKRGTGCCENT